MGTCVQFRPWHPAKALPQATIITKAIPVLPCRWELILTDTNRNRSARTSLLFLGKRPWLGVENGNLTSPRPAEWSATPQHKLWDHRYVTSIDPERTIY